MPSDDNTLTRRRVLGGLVTVGAAGAASGTGTVAYFTDTTSGPTSTVDSGWLDLQFDSADTFGIETSLEPSQYVEGSVTLRNAASKPGSLDVDVSYSENDAAGADDITATEVAQRLSVDTLQYGSGTDANDLSGVAANLAELASRDVTSGESTANDIVDLADPGMGRDFSIGLSYQTQSGSKKPDGDGISITVTFILNQTNAQ